MLQETAAPASAFSLTCSPSASRLRRDRSELDDLILTPAPDTTARQPSPAEIEPLWRTASAAVGVPLARPEVIATVQARDPDAVWIVEQSGSLAGGFAFLPLSSKGVAALLSGDFHARDPDPRFLVDAAEKPAAVYCWLVFKLGRAARVTTPIFELLRSERFRAADVWTTAITSDGRRFFCDLGLEPVPAAAQPNLYRYIRKTNRSEARDR